MIPHHSLKPSMHHGCKLWVVSLHYHCGTLPSMGKIKHGENLGATKRRSKLYMVWMGMRARCRDPKHISYKNYGARGVRVDSRWDDYNAFRDWSYANGYEEGAGLEIDRKDSNEHYCPENCRWITKKENRRRQQPTIIAFGEAKTLVEWSEDPRCQCPYYTLRNRMSRGWEKERAISTPNNKPGHWHQPRFLSNTK